MAILDVILIVPMIYAIYKGIKQGLILELCTFLAFFVGLYIAFYWSAQTATFLQNTWNIQTEYLPLIAFTVTFFAVIILVFWGGRFLEKLLDKTAFSLINKLLGAFFSLLKTAYLFSVSIVLLETYALGYSFFSTSITQESILYNPLKQLSIRTYPSLKATSIELKDKLIKDKTTPQEEN